MRCDYVLVAAGSSSSRQTRALAAELIAVRDDGASHIALARQTTFTDEQSLCSFET